MNWISQNYQWIFSGIGVLILGVFLELWRRSSQKASGKQSEATLTAQGAKVTNSPVASGNNIKQEVNAPIIHHAENVHIGLPAPALPETHRHQNVSASLDQNKPLVKTQEPTHNLAFCCAETAWIVEIDHGVFVPRDNALPAALLKFSNDAVKDAITKPAFVKATVIYRDEAGERLRITGGWLEQVSGNIQFNVDESHKLIVAFVLNNELCTTKKRELFAHRRQWWTSDLHRFGEASTMNVLVRLTGARSGYCFFEREFEISKDPLRISAVKAT